MSPSEQDDVEAGVRRLSAYLLLGLIALVCVLPVALLAVLARAESQWVLGVDQRGASWGEAGRSWGLTGTAQFVTDCGDPLTVTVLTLVLAGWFWTRGHKRAATYLVGARLGAILLSTGLKLIVGRERPDLAGQFAGAYGSSFPSGHTFGSLVLAATLVIALGAAHRKAAWVGVVTFSLLVGSSRVVLGVHYLTDVLGGLLLGAGWVAAVTLLLGYLTRSEKRGSDPAPPVSLTERPSSPPAD